MHEVGLCMRWVYSRGGFIHEVGLYIRWIYNYT